MAAAIPKVFQDLFSDGCIEKSDVLNTADGFFVVYRSIEKILSSKDVREFLDSDGDWLACDRFFDDWFLYAVPKEKDYAYGLLKLREQEHDAEVGSPADGDTPGVTVSFVAFDIAVLLDCLANPTNDNRTRLFIEINRVVGYKNQRHHKSIKQYFKKPQSKGAYLVADLYTKHIAAFASNGRLAVSDAYKEIVQHGISYKNSVKWARIPRFIDALNQKAGYTVCDNEYIYFQNPKEPTVYERLAILATHTGNVSVYSFAAEVEYHARFLTPLAKLKIPFFGKSIYDSAVRADMTIGDNEFEGPAPFYRLDSKIVRRQYALHRDDINPNRLS